MSHGSISRIGVDTGGTFTDFVVVQDGKIQMFKELSTPAQPDDAVIHGIDRLGELSVKEIVHGSTVATNALLERKGARTALLTTEGFEDVLVIGRQTRPDLYNIFVTRPEPLVRENLRLGVRERMLEDGSVRTPLDRKRLQAIIRRLRKLKVESIAVSLLHAYANSAHEDAIDDALQALGLPVSLSSRILPEYREYERTSTTVINAYLAPLMSSYLSRLETRTKSTLRVMQSNGGAVRSQTAAAAPVRTILSGPAGGVTGAFHMAQACGYSRIITFDMGGTSTDVSLCDGSIQITQESQIDGMPAAIPMIDIHTVGAGGGSIAEVDAGGALKVGPESAGADPGPICYGKGARFTVTDANVLLGRLRPQFFLGGAMKLAAERIEPAIDRMPWTRRWNTPEDLAQGVIDVVNNNMEQAIRLISVERGHDPRDFTLLSFGGAGGLHAVHLARSLGMRQVVVPRFPGALSALGLLIADVRKDYSRTLLVDPDTSARPVKRAFTELHRLGFSELGDEGFRRTQIAFHDFVDLRYRGQSYELTVRFEGDFLDRFHDAHERRYGYSNRGRDVEIVNVRTTFSGRTEKPVMRKAPPQRRRAAPLEVQRIWIDGRRVKTRVYDREQLGRGQVIQGPAIIGEYSSTTLVPPDFRCVVDAWLNLVIRG